MNHKIKTDIGYCVVSDDCALDEEELKTLAADIKKQPKLTQPNFFIDMRYDYKFIQLQALLKITELLQPVIQGNIKNKTSGIANMDCVSVYQERNEVEIVLPLASFGVLRHYYEELRAALIAMPTIQVDYPKWSHQFRKTLHGKGPLCTYVAISRDEKNKRRELVHFFFPIEVAACMVTPQFGFTRLLQRSLEKFKNIYTTKIYLQICRSADAGKWVVSYSTLRKILCVGNKFRRYYDFRNRILKEAENALRGNSNHWFGLAECFKKGEQDPYLLIFNIYSANNRQNSYDEYNRLRDKMLSTMVDSMHIMRATALALTRKVNIRNYNYVWRKHNLLIANIAGNDEVLDKKAYYVSTMERIIETEKYSKLAVQQDLF